MELGVGSFDVEWSVGKLGRELNWAAGVGFDREWYWGMPGGPVAVIIIIIIIAILIAAVVVVII